MSSPNTVLNVLDNALASNARRDRVGDAITELEQALNALVPGASSRITARNRVERIAALSAAISAASKGRPAISVVQAPATTSTASTTPKVAPMPAPISTAPAASDEQAIEQHMLRGMSRRQAKIAVGFSQQIKPRK